MRISYWSSDVCSSDLFGKQYRVDLALTCGVRAKDRGKRSTGAIGRKHVLAGKLHPARAGRVADHGCEIEAAAFDDALHFRRGKLATRRGGLAVMLPERPADVDDVILQYFPQLAHVGDQCSVAVELGQAGRKIVSLSTFRRLRIFMQRVDRKST